MFEAQFVVRDKDSTIPNSAHRWCTRYTQHRLSEFRFCKFISASRTNGDCVQHSQRMGRCMLFLDYFVSRSHTEVLRRTTTHTLTQPSIEFLRSMTMYTHTTTQYIEQMVTVYLCAPEELQAGRAFQWIMWVVRTMPPAHTKRFLVLVCFLGGGPTTSLYHSINGQTKPYV